MMAKYIASLKRQEKRYQRAIFLPSVMGMLINTALFVIVLNGPRLGIPRNASLYLQDTLFYRFSRSQLSHILITEVGSDALLPPLLSIYWGYHLFFVLLCAVLPAFASTLYSRRLKRVRYKRGLLDSEAVLQSIAGYLKNPSRLNHLKLIWVTRRAGFHDCVCPVRPEWYRSPEFQWISTDAINKDVWAIIAALAKFRDALVCAIKHSLDLKPFIRPVKTLQEFYFSVASRTDESLHTYEDHPANDERSEQTILGAFAKEARPAIINSARARCQAAKPHPVRVWFNRVFRSHLVRVAGSVSVVAAIVMVVGVILFRIPPTQAFTTWFTVSFGSLSISVGISSFVTEL